MIAFRIVPPAEALHFVDFSTIILLFSMMLIVGNLHLVGFFEWNVEFILRRLKPAHLLPVVVFACGLFSAFFVNDIVCLVMVPFVLAITRRMRLAPLPYLLAVATSSNVGSVATITGNPQNMLIGSYSGIPYREFLVHLGPVALAGLFLNWGVLHWMCMRRMAGAPKAQSIPLPELDLSRLTKPAIVVTAVIIGFMLGVPPAMMAALGAAALLITRTTEPRKLYDEVDWGLLVFFVGLFVIVGGADKAGIVARLLEFAHHWNLQRLSIFTLVVTLFSNIVSNLTITGSVANIIVVETAKTEVQIGFWDYFRVGFPITLLTILFGFFWLTVV